VRPLGVELLDEGVEADRRPGTRLACTPRPNPGLLVGRSHGAASHRHRPGHRWPDGIDRSSDQSGRSRSVWLSVSSFFYGLILSLRYYSCRIYDPQPPDEIQLIAPPMIEGRAIRVEPAEVESRDTDGAERTNPIPAPAVRSKPWRATGFRRPT